MNRVRKQIVQGQDIVSAKYGLGVLLNAAAKELEKHGYPEPLRHLGKISQMPHYPGNVAFKHSARWQLSFTPIDINHWWNGKKILVVITVDCDDRRHSKRNHFWEVVTVEVLNAPYFSDYEPITFL